jgi:hypothetical protein
MARKQNTPRTFFLNEQHELTPSEKAGGGRSPQYASIPWAAKATRISQSLQSVAEEVEKSSDPLKNDRYFVLTLPVPKVKKYSEPKKKPQERVFYEEETRFGAEHGRVFDRLGLDLLQVTDDGRAVVHANKEKFQQVLHRAEALESLGQREQARWATIDSFETIPLELRVDAGWLQQIRGDEIADIVIELQPVLARLDADRVLRTIADMLVRHNGEQLTGTGTDFSGRYWLRGRARQKSIRRIAKDFYSVQAIHSPLYSIAASKISSRIPSASVPLHPGPLPPDLMSLPCVAVVDTGVPAEHRQLRPYRRGQFYLPDGPRAAVGNHGSIVASRVVFGDCPSHRDLGQTPGQCSFFDAIVAEFPVVDPKRINDKRVIPAMEGVRGASPDVRVFNLSIGDERTFSDFASVEQREKRLLLQDLDNFVFANDCIVVVAAGNSLPGVLPSHPYPDHHVDARWMLGPWAAGFNTMVCGSFVSQLSADGLVQTLGWPSPFCRIGPGLCECPTPSFSAEGGNVDDTYNRRPGLGVWGLSATGLAEDHSGTSFAAPILARESALTLHALQQFCAPGTQPFAVTARAFLTLTASHPYVLNGDVIGELASRTLGIGKANMQRLITPSVGSAVMLWQGYVESSRDTVRVQLPIPLAWLDEASDPILRMVICSDPPVNEAAHGAWVCRRVRPVLHPGPEVRGIKAPRSIHATYPTVDRKYPLSRYKPGAKEPAVGDLWLMEISYEEIAPYPPATDFDSRQRVAFAAELVDHGETAADPQAAMQALPMAASMNRLSIQSVSVRSPIIIRTRV